MERSNSMSLTVLVIVLAMLGLLVGYLLGNWFIQLVTGGSTDSSQLAETNNKVVEEEIILEDDDTKESSSQNYILDSSSQMDENNNMGDSNNTFNQDGQIKTRDVFVIQVGAFNSMQNAREFSNELLEKGFQTVIADESIPYKVQIGAFTDKDKAEEIEKKVEALGYDAFITH